MGGTGRRKRNYRKQSEGDKWKDILLDIVMCIPEVLLLPVRILYYLGKILMHALRHAVEAL
ncbi:hypothetical protein [Salimicrobium flavidum]|uniref:Uncharacterized protein n=1 Tax=Salimicrobium flavidum TaxID=570947 RepID=A0A1N7J9A5_9BACI|nr:hypothetical protein [Salimicrobium flavidum]SIS45841.1 hypothetical protein SAMN05421687_104181 [Salimicrobium flavidum]